MPPAIFAPDRPHHRRDRSGDRVGDMSALYFRHGLAVLTLKCRSPIIVAIITPHRRSIYDDRKR